jgi:membrane associated rhomboid family serine protease
MRPTLTGYHRRVLPLRDNVPTRSFPLVTVALIVANVLVWVLYQLPDLNGSITSLAYQPCEVEGSCPQVGHGWLLTSVTSMFMHGSWAHLLGNMLFLWIFGNNVEDALGPVRYVAFYFLGGFAATATQTFVTLMFAGDVEATIPSIGASGAISAVLGGYIVLLPNAKVLTVIFFILRELPAALFLGIWFGFQLLEGSSSILHPQAGGGVAFFAHIGGFVFGVATVKLFQKRRPLAPVY